ncbi:MAG: hypothetical protein K2X82_16635 [Gemmataceae bacterium]|nr:hypothetical protein [Gemmataceae bacterium]
MNKLDLPADVIAKLACVDGPTKVLDAAGEPQAVVLPPDLYQQMFDAWADAQFDPASLERARQQTGGYTTAEAVAFVRKLAAENGKS